MAGFTVRIASAVRHIDSKHVRDPDEGPLWAELLASGGDLASALEPEIQRSLLRPLFVLYDQHDVKGAFLHKTRECVTRAGLVAVVRLTDDASGDLVTAFFPYETFEARPKRRELAARASRIALYGCRVIFGQARTALVPPAPGEVFPSTDPAGERRNVAFVDDANWDVHSVEIAGTTCRVFGKPTI